VLLKIDVPDVAGDQKQGVQFGRGRLGDSQELMELGWPIAVEALADIGHDRYRRASKLI
jgi:hypothetical protein